MVHKRIVWKLAKKTGLADEKPAEDRLQHLMQIVVVFAVLLLFIAWLNTITVIKMPGTFVGAGLVTIDTADEYSAYAVKSLQMGLDFMIINTENPEIEALCAQEEKIYGFNCYFASDNILDGEELKVCSYAELTCNALEVRVPKDLERAVVSCTSLPPSENCVLRAFPLWHRTVFTALGILYFLIVLFSVIFRQESISNKVLKFWRHLI
jgi:hypothetical protein